MAVVAASSRRSLIFIVVPFLISLLAVSVSAGMDSLPVAAEQQEVCGPVKGLFGY
ncbi:hypothetical protein ACP70R_003773 [Stipagrostis hirtigluma subsp. patula]